MAKKKKIDTSGATGSGFSDSTETRTVRIRVDLCDMIKFLADVNQQTVLEFLDPILREEILRRMEPFLDVYQAKQKAEAEFNALIQKAKAERK